MRASAYFKSAVAVSSLLLAVSFPFASAQAEDFYQVVNVESNDSLNMRSGPGTAYPVVGSIPYNGRTIMTTGTTEQVGSSTWIEVVWLGQVGWVNEHYLNAGYQQPAVQPQPVQPRKPAAINYNNPVSAANSHTHPANRCTRSVTHSHPNGQNAHEHHYSCEPRAKAPQNVRPVVLPADNANTHSHPANRCTRSVTHTHPNGARTHEHHYSCDPQTMARPKYHQQPKYIRY
ncbi:MAG: SH3 domain-containing protein [Thiolinea sp.]